MRQATLRLIGAPETPALEHGIGGALWQTLSAGAVRELPQLCWARASSLRMQAMHMLSASMPGIARDCQSCAKGIVRQEAECLEMHA